MASPPVSPKHTTTMLTNIDDNERELQDSSEQSVSQESNESTNSSSQCRSLCESFAHITTNHIQNDDKVNDVPKVLRRSQRIKNKLKRKQCTDEHQPNTKNIKKIKTNDHHQKQLIIQSESNDNKENLTIAAAAETDIVDNNGKTEESNKTDMSNENDNNNIICPNTASVTPPLTIMTSGTQDSSSLLSSSLSFVHEWDWTKTPNRSSLKVKKQPSAKRSINWGNVRIRNFEQRCGINSSAVPSTKGPSLHLGAFISEQTQDMDDFESSRYANNKDVSYLSSRQRVMRVKQFSPNDVKRKNRKADEQQIGIINDSRKHIGCDCKSMFECVKSEIIDNIVFLCSKKQENDENNTNDDGAFDDVNVNKKKLNKLKKWELLVKLKEIEMEMFGRYDVCCVDERCLCFRNGIRCEINGDDCCQCGEEGHYVYKNDDLLMQMGIKEEGNNNNDISLKKVKINKKKKSFACANKNGNNFQTNVLDFVGANGEGDYYDNEKGICKEVNYDTMPFKSPKVQKQLSEWSSFYEQNLFN